MTGPALETKLGRSVLPPGRLAELGRVARRGGGGQHRP